MAWSKLDFYHVGGLHGFYMILTKRFHAIIDKIPRVVNQIITLLFVNFTWILFRSGSFEVSRGMAKAIFQNQWGALPEEICSFMHIPILHELAGEKLPHWMETVLILIIIGIMLFESKNIEEKAKGLKHNVFSVCCVVFVLVISILSFSGMSTFLYAYF